MWICWASCSSHCTFNYSCTQITSRIPASMSRLPPPHANTLLLLLKPPSRFHSLPPLCLFFGVSAVRCRTVTCLRATCSYGFHSDTFWSLQQSRGGKHISGENNLNRAASCLWTPTADTCWLILFSSSLRHAKTHTHTHTHTHTQCSSHSRCTQICRHAQIYTFTKI